MVLVRIVTSGWYVSDVQGEHTRSVVGVESADRKVPAGHVKLLALHATLFVPLLKEPAAHGAHVRLAIAEPGDATKDPGAQVADTKGHAIAGWLPSTPDEFVGAGWKVSGAQGEHVRSAVAVAAAA